MFCWSLHSCFLRLLWTGRARQTVISNPATPWIKVRCPAVSTVVRVSRAWLKKLFQLSVTKTRPNLHPRICLQEYYGVAAGKHCQTRLYSHPVIVCPLVSHVRTQLSFSLNWVDKSHMLWEADPSVKPHGDWRKFPCRLSRAELFPANQDFWRDKQLIACCRKSGSVALHTASKHAVSDSHWVNHFAVVGEKVHQM